MKRNKIFKIAISILLLFCFVTVLAGLAKIVYGFAAQHPPEPIAQGDFPASPTWIFSAGEKIIASPAVKDQILVTKTSSKLYAINLEKRSVLWEVDSPMSQDLGFAPVIANSLAIAVEDGSRLVAYSLESGEIIWKTPTIKNANYVAASVQSVAFNKAYLYVARYNWSLTAYDLQTGEVIWEYKSSARSFPYVQANEKYVYIAVAGTLHVFQSVSGTKLRSMEWGGVIGPVLLSTNTLFVIDQTNSSIISLDAETLRVNWNKNYQSIITPYGSSCLLESDENLFISSHKLIKVSKLDGAVLWATDELDRLECPVLLGDKIFVRNTATTLYMIDNGTGRVEGQLLVQMNTPMNHDFFRNPTVSNGWLAVPFGDNRLLLYQP